MSLYKSQVGLGGGGPAILPQVGRAGVGGMPQLPPQAPTMGGDVMGSGGPSGYAAQSGGGLYANQVGGGEDPVIPNSRNTSPIQQVLDEHGYGRDQIDLSIGELWPDSPEYQSQWGGLAASTGNKMAALKDPSVMPLIQGGNAYDTAWNINNYQDSLRTKLYDPLLKDTAGQIGNSQQVGKATWDTAVQEAVGEGISSRNKSRYGMNVSPAQAEYEKSARSRNLSLRMSNNRNNARIDEYEYDNSLRRGIINTGRDQMSNASAAAGIGAASAAGRESAGAQARAAHKAQQQQSVAAAVGTMLTIAAMVT